MLGRVVLAGCAARRAPSHPEEIGLKIATEASAKDDGFGNFTASQTMVLRNKQGQESRRLTPSVGLGLRHDWGDAETGFGLELGGWVQPANQGLRLQLTWGF